MAQPSLFDQDSEPIAKPVSDGVVRLRVLITVKAAPNPSESYGETVCVAGLRLDQARLGWVRLYPINFRALTSSDQFKKYEVVTVDAVPARQDQRRESWKPHLPTLKREQFLPPWRARRGLLDPLIEESMCRLNRAAREDANSQSLALVRPRQVYGLSVTRHPGWTPEQQRKIDAYANQPDLFNHEDPTPLQPPRFRGTYHYLCHDDQCRGHKQGMLDWEFVALQLKLQGGADDALTAQLQTRFLTEMCKPSRDVAFYVGNQARRPHVFSVLGVYYPPR
ncbi:hypothetical protein JQS43_24460 [Natronosporangium hydrolyticum]|uniref:Uncharacterized protein n=1 Tax=Natronosporangium hydrolyticum TaxID=2811111 RepID=A0A895YA16_9ACTN|nr:hypothetical protein [Natronosporangium hydrolyticum]QSB14587.1 hypothetical protein JQS43_24460 [Natronosporangium hydrolyticum]